MGTLDRLLYVLLAALLATLAFELRDVLVLSNLQWLFVALSVVALPIIVRERRRLYKERLVVAAIAFVCISWISALLAPDFTSNAVKAAVRITAGFIILCISLCVRNSQGLKRVWAVSAVLAALYGMADYAGFGAPQLFRNGNFYYADVMRLSGSFEYPNTAASFFALSLPIVCTAAGPLWVRIGGALIIWSALLMTYSRGAALAVLVLLGIWAARAGPRIILPFLLLCGAVFAGALALHPTLVWRFLGEQGRLAFSVRYEPEVNMMWSRPN